MLGDKASRGSKWTVLDAGKKYLTMPIYDGAVPEEVSFFLVKLELYSCTRRYSVQYKNEPLHPVLCFWKSYHCMCVFL